jgi:hypothetical protein
MRIPGRVASLLTCLALLTAGAVTNATATSTPTFTGPAYTSAACTPTPAGIGPHQWNASVGLPLTPSGTPLPQRLVIGELNETANPVAVNNLLRQCGITEVTLLTENWPGATLTPGGESTLDATVIGAALPPNTSITMAVSPANQGFYGMLVVAADACGFNFAGDPTAILTTITKGVSYPAGGCIISLSYNSAESPNVSNTAQVEAAWMMDQLEAQGAIVVVAAGDEGAGGCISSAGNPFGSGVAHSVTAFALTSNLATLTTSVAHGFTTGQQVYLSNIGTPFQGMFTISSVPTTTTFSFGLPRSTDIPTTSPTSPGAAWVNFGGLTPQFLATHPGVVAVGGTQWISQTQTMTTGLGVPYVPGSTYSNYVWKDKNSNPNCANLSTFPYSGGEATGGGQSAIYTMPSFQTTAATSSYPGATNFRMIPDVAGLAGWPTYAISNYGMSASAKQLIDSAAMIVTSQNNGFTIGETVTVAGVGAPFDGTFTVTGTPYTNAFSYTTAAITIANTALTSNVATVTTSSPHGLTAGQLVDVVGATNTAFNGAFVVTSAPTTTTFTYAKTNVDVISASSVGRVDVEADWQVTGTVTQSCVASGTPAICSAATFPWSPVVGTSAAAPLIAVGLANVNAVLTARGMAPIDNAGGAMDVHRIFYDPANSSAMTDVTNGDNDIMNLGGWSALPGYDMTTGMGVPNFSTLANLIIARNTPASPVDPSPQRTEPTPTSSASVTRTPEPIATPIRTPVTLAPGVQVPAGARVFGTRIVTSEPASSSIAAVPTSDVVLNRWTNLRVPGVTPKAVVSAQIRVNMSWFSIGKATANRNGVVKLPAVRLTKPGEYPIRLVTSKAERTFVKMNAVRPSPTNQR